MRNLSAFLKTSIVASSVFATFSVTAVADSVPPFAGITPFPGGNPYYTSGSIATPLKLVDNQDYPLNCGTTYAGPIDLSGRSNVKIHAPSTGCASGQNPVIIPGAPINGNWTVYDSANNIYSKSVSFQVGQVFMNSQLVSVAHYPDSITESGWLQLSTPTNTKGYDPASPLTITYTGLPSGLKAADVQGAQINYRGNNPWAIGTRNVSGYDPAYGTLSLDAISDLDLRAEDAPNVVRFYLEGKLWMLPKMNPSSTGWAFVADSTGGGGGTLYLKLASGQTLNDLNNSLNIWAAASIRRVIDARGSTGSTISNVRVVGGDVGIDASPLDTPAGTLFTTGLQVLNSEVSYSNWSAIYASYAKTLTVDHSTISGPLHSGIYARSGTMDTTVTHSIFNYVSNIGMHRGGDAAVYINWDSGPKVNSNQFFYVGKEAISVGQSTYSVVNSNTVTGACINHGDCGAIYLHSATNKHALYARVIGNTVTHVTGEIVRPNGTNPERYSIYLDDYANSVLVQGNIVKNNASGMQIHSGYNNTIQGNIFGGNAQRDIQVDDSGIAGELMYNNYIYSNTFEGPEPAFSFYFSAATGNQPPLAGVANPAVVFDNSATNINTYYTSVISDTTTGLVPPQTTSPAPSPTATPSPSPSPSASPSGSSWVKCASENGICTFNGTQTVRYGTGSSWVTKVATGSIACNNSVFGDPANGYVKECDVNTSGAPAPSPSPSVSPSPSASPSGSNWVKCASENGTCSFSGTYTVRYGTGSSWVTKTLSNGTACSNSVFGDPANGYVKECDIDMSSGSSPSPSPSPTVSPSPTPSPSAAVTWTKCASENGICTFNGTHTVRYGAGSSWATKVATGSIACNNSVFGDPVYGTAKECDVGQ